MWPQAAEFNKEIFIKGDAALGIDVELDHPAVDAFGIELLIPR